MPRVTTGMRSAAASATTCADLFGRARQDDHIRAVILEGAVVAVDARSSGVVRTPSLPDDFYRVER